MKLSLYLVVALFVPVSLLADNPSLVDKELGALKGTWKAIAMEAGGQALPKASIPDFTFIVTVSGKATSKSPFGNYQATISVDSQKNPKTIDNLHETGSQQGSKQFGIYRLKDDLWTVCMTPPGAAEEDRPKDFNTKGTANAVIVFKRHEENQAP